MREIKLLVTLQVDECDADLTIVQHLCNLAAIEAVENALVAGENEGFCHSQANALSFNVVGVELYQPGKD